MIDARFVDWLAQDLARRGARFAFGVPGGGVSLDLMSAAQSAGLQTVVTAREDAAAIMAGVAGRLAHAPGLAFSTKGPGLASATNGMASALLDRMPTLLAAEAFDQEELVYLSHQVFDQAALANSLFGAVHNGKAKVVRPCAEDVAECLDAMLTPPFGPALLLAEPDGMTAPISNAPAATKSVATAADPSALDRAAHLLRQAKRPVIVVGLEATAPGIASELSAFAEAVGAPVLTTYMAKGVIPSDHPLYGGIFTGGAIEQATVGAGDLIILVGLDPVELIRKPWPYKAATLDLAALAYDPHYVTPTERVIGRLDRTLAQLTQTAVAGEWSGEEVSRHRQTFLDGMAMPAGQDGLSAEAVVRETEAAFAGARPRLTVDAGAHMFSACAFWPATEPLDVLISNGLASMGFALPAAIAAALHEPERGAVAMTGDGGLLMCLGELKTAATVGANLLVVVFNDARLSLIDIKREQRQMQDLGLAWPEPNFADVAKGFGFQVWRARDTAEMRAAATAAAGAVGPRLIDARIDAAGYLPQLRALRG